MTDEVVHEKWKRDMPEAKDHDRDSKRKMPRFSYNVGPFGMSGLAASMPRLSTDVGPSLALAQPKQPARAPNPYAHPIPSSIGQQWRTKVRGSAAPALACNDGQNCGAAPALACNATRKLGAVQRQHWPAMRHES